LCLFEYGTAGPYPITYESEQHDYLILRSNHASCLIVIHAKSNYKGVADALLLIIKE